MKNLHLELQFIDADFDRLQSAWNTVLKNHDLLQSTVDKEGNVVKQTGTDYAITSYNLYEQPADKVRKVQQKLREDNNALSVNVWPWFDIKATKYHDNTIRVYCQFANGMVDEEQIQYILREWLALYQQPSLKLNPVQLHRAEETVSITAAAKTVRYRHLLGRLDHQTLTKLRGNSESFQLALPVVLLNNFKSTLAKHNFEYPVYMSLANRFPLYPFMYDRAKFATSAVAMNVDSANTEHVVQACETLSTKLREASLNTNDENISDLIALQHGEKEFALFNCSVEQDLGTGPLFARIPDIIFCNFQLPTAMVDYSVWENNGQLMYRWSYAKSLPQLSTDIDKKSLNKILADFPEAKEILEDNQDAAKKRKLTGLKAAGLLAATGAAVGGAKASNKKNGNSAVAPAAATAGAASLTGDKDKNNAQQDSDQQQNSDNDISSNAENNQLEQANADNSAMDQSFTEHQESMLDLSDDKQSWQQETGNSLDPNAPTSAQQQNHASNLAALGAGSAAALLAATLENLKDANSQEKPKEMPEAPEPETLAEASDEEIDAAFDDYDNKAMQVHSMSSKSDLAQTDMCAQFTDMAGQMGPDINKVQDDLMGMGKNMDTLAADMAKGDFKAAATGLDAIGGDHIKLVDKMNAEGIPGSITENPINQKAVAIADATAAIDEKTTLPELIDLNDKVDALDAAIDLPEQAMTEQKDALLKKVSEPAQAAIDDIKSSAAFQKTQEKADAVKNLGNEVIKYDCSSLAEAASKEKIEALAKKAQELKDSVPEPKNPVAEQLDDLQEKSTAVQEKASALQDKVKAGMVTPEIAIQDPGLQSALGGLNKSAAGFASNIQGQCPICSASKPSLPAVPNCDHNHTDVVNMTNPFHMPSMQLDDAIGNLKGLSLPKFQPKIPPIIDKLKGIKNKMEGLNPVPAVPSVPNPYDALKSVASSMRSKISSQAKKLADCPNYSDDLKAKLSSAQTDLKNAEDKLTTLISNENTESTAEKMAAYKEQMKDELKSQPGKQKDALISKAGQAKSQAQGKFSSLLASAKSDSTKNAMAACACWKGANLPAIKGGSADEIIITGFKLKCPVAAGGPMPIMIPPNTTKINNRDALLLNGKPVMQPMGLCPPAAKGPVIPPCVGNILVVPKGIPAKTSISNFPVATRKSVSFKCGGHVPGTEVLLIDCGQPPGKKPTKAQ